MILTSVSNLYWS